MVQLDLSPEQLFTWVQVAFAMRWRGGEGRGGDCPHFPQTRTFVTAEPSRSPVKWVTG